MLCCVCCFEIMFRGWIENKGFFIFFFSFYLSVSKNEYNSFLMSQSSLFETRWAPSSLSLIFFFRDYIFLITILKSFKDAKMSSSSIDLMSSVSKLFGLPGPIKIEDYFQIMKQIFLTFYLSLKRSPLLYLLILWSDVTYLHSFWVP